jgi:hypothetical protein
MEKKIIAKSKAKAKVCPIRDYARCDMNSRFSSASVKEMLDPSVHSLPWSKLHALLLETCETRHHACVRQLETIAAIQPDFFPLETLTAEEKTLFQQLGHVVKNIPTAPREKLRKYRAFLEEVKRTQKHPDAISIANKMIKEIQALLG